MKVDSGAGVSACSVGNAKPGSVNLPVVGGGGDRIEHIGEETVGHATRGGANVEIAFEAAKVRRSLLSVGSLVEKGQVAVFTDSGGYIFFRRLSMKRQNGHFWLPLARHIETPENLVTVAPVEGAAEEQDVTEKMDEEFPVEERSAHKRTHLPFFDFCPYCVACRASDPGHRLTVRAEGEPPMVQIDNWFASDVKNVETSAGQVVTAGPMVTAFMATFCGRGAARVSMRLGVSLRERWC